MIAVKARVRVRVMGVRIRVDPNLTVVQSAQRRPRSHNTLGHHSSGRYVLALVGPHNFIRGWLFMSGLGGLGLVMICL